MEIYHTGLVSKVPVAARIWTSLEKDGIECYGLSTKCIDITQDHVDQILSLLQAGIDWPEEEKAAYLKDLEAKWRRKEKCYGQ